MKKPNILFLDVETTPNLGWIWGKYEQNVIEFVSEGGLLCFVAKWADEKSPLVCDKRIGYTRMLQKLWTLLDRADIIIAHNGDRFDVRKINAAFLEKGLPPPSPYKTVDTKKAAKRYFFLNSNKLDDLGKLLKLGEKIKHEGFSLWTGCMKGDTEAWFKMLKYNTQDVLLLEKVYYVLRPWIVNHPNVSQVTGDYTACPKCGSYDIERRGVRHLSTCKKRRHKCLTCKGWFELKYE